MTAGAPIDIQSDLDLPTASTPPLHTETNQPTDKMPRTKKQAASTAAPRPATPSDPDSPSPIPDLQVPEDSQETVVMEVAEIEEVELPETQQVAGPSREGPPKRKRIRPSKKEIANYEFTDEQQRVIAEFVRDNDCLFNKRNREWANPTRKDELWKECAAALDGCTGLQVRKFFEAKRTDFGKIEKKAFKSGAAAKRLTAREEEVMSMWGFLGGHIAHEATQSSHTFSPSASRHGDNDEASSGDLSGLSAASLERRRRQRRAASQEGEQQLTSQLGDFMETLQSYIPRRSSSNLSATEKSHEMGIQHAVTILNRIHEDFREEFIFTILKTGHQLLGDNRVNREWKENLARGKVSLHRPARPATHDSGTQTSPSPPPSAIQRQWQHPPPPPPPASNVVYVPQYVTPAQHQQQQLIHRAVTYTAPAAASPQPHQAFSMGPLTFSPPTAAPSPQPTSQPPPCFPTPSPASMVPMSPYPDVPPTPGRSLETPQPVAVPPPVTVQEERKDEEENDDVI